MSARAGWLRAATSTTAVGSSPAMISSSISIKPPPSSWLPIAQADFARHLGRIAALPAQPLRSVPDHDDAAGGRPQARVHRPAGDVGGPGSLRGRLHHLHADRLRHACRTRRLPPPGPRSASSSAATTCRRSRGSTPTRTRAPRRPTRRSDLRASRSGRRPRPGLRGDQFRLYELIWMRTVASQMRDAEGFTVSVKIDARAPGRRASRARSSPRAGRSPSTDS